MPAVIWVHDEETAGERAAIEVAPHCCHTGVLVVVEHTVQLIQRCVLPWAVVDPVSVAAMRKLSNADDRNPPPELHV